MVPMRRALRLVIDGKAEVVETDADRVVRSERLTLPRPIVIRLMKFIHVPRRFRRQVTNTFLFALCDRPQAEGRVDPRPPRATLAWRHQRLVERRHGMWVVQHAQGESTSNRNRNAPAGAASRAALRALELGGSSPDAYTGALYPVVLRRGYAASVGRVGAAKRGGLAPAGKDALTAALGPYARKVFERAS